MNNCYTMDFGGNIKSNNNSINDLQIQYSDKIIAFSQQLQSDGYKPDKVLYDITKLYNDNYLRNIFLGGSCKTQILFNELKEIECEYLWNYYEAVSDIFVLREYIEIIQKYPPT